MASVTRCSGFTAGLGLAAAAGVVVLVLLAPTPARAACNSANPTNPENDCDLDGCTVGQGDCLDDPTRAGAAVRRGASCPNGAASEVCDGFDNNCRDGVDEGNPGGGGACDTGRLGVCRPGTVRCQSGALTCAQNVGSSTESCNNLDDDCDGSVDENNPGGGGACTVSGQQGVCAAGTRQCQSGALQCVQTTAASAERCNNQDDDCDGAIDNGFSLGAACTSSNPGVCAPGTVRCASDGGTQCTSNVAPNSRSETCNSQDDDCDGLVDEGNIVSCYSGSSGDLGGIRLCRRGLQACVNDAGSGACVGEVLPVAELCDNQDNDCDGVRDNGFDAGRACATGLPGACDAGVITCASDGGVYCRSTVTPGGAEQCNGLDDNCNGLVDENPSQLDAGLTRRCFTGGAGTFTGVCPGSSPGCALTTPTCAGGACTPRTPCAFGTQACADAGWEDACPGERLPGAEVCNSQDDDCDGVVDDGLWVDADSDTFRSCASACRDGGPCDCNDGNAAINPSAAEVCDAIDQDCDGRLDDVAQWYCFAGPGITTANYSGTCPSPTAGVCRPRATCTVGRQACTDAGVWAACASYTGPVAEVCNGLDDDCDGVVDNGAPDNDGDGVRVCDCDDNDPQTKPGAPEKCDNKDNDCDGIVDGALTECYSGTLDTRGKGICRAGQQTCSAGVGVGACQGEVLPESAPDAGERSCDGRDENCNGVVDDGYDSDGDGVTTCSAPPDCDDSDPFNAPGRRELCDCRDNDCDGLIDEGNACDQAPCHDFDTDEVSNCAGDCDDLNAAVSPRLTEIVGDGLDNDCDGAVDEVTDEDGDGVFTGARGAGDCNDRLEAVRPGAVEACDGFDNDCDGLVDEGFDQDGDGVTTCAGDCNDADGNVGPFRREVCGNGRDDNCDGRVDESTDLDGDGVTTCDGDCNDYLASVYGASGARPAAAEVCDGQDNNCDGRVDEGFDQDGDFSAVCLGDCDDRNPNVNPSRVELAGNGIDDDCDGLVDEGADDRDGDGFSPFCGDCNDANPAVHPHAPEVCDRIDNDCNGYVDSLPGRADLCAICFDADGDGQTNCDGDCNDTDATIYRGAAEVCDLKDNDCDEQVDLDPSTFTSVCLSGADAGGGDGGADGGDDGGADGGGDGGPADAGPTPARPVVATSCGCASGGGGGLGVAWAVVAAGLGALARRRGRGARSSTSPAKRRATAPQEGRRAASVARGAGPLVAVAALALFLACPSVLDVPLPAPGDGGPAGDASVADAGTDGGFRPPVAVWPCPELLPIEVIAHRLPGSDRVLAARVDQVVSRREAAQLLFVDDAARDLAAFVVLRPLPPGVDPSLPTALDELAARELPSLDALTGTPLVQERIERFTRSHAGAQMARTLVSTHTVVLAGASNAFALRNRLALALSGRSASDLGVLPTAPGAAVDSDFVVALFFRLGDDGLVMGVTAAPVARFAEHQTSFGDLSNGTHLSEPDGFITYGCEQRVMPSLTADLVFVVDNSASMIEEQTALANAASSLFTAFRRSGMDFRVGVVTTDSDVLRGGGFTSDLSQFERDVRVGIAGNPTEMGLEFGLRAVRLALDGGSPERTLRPDAARIVLVFSDEENASLVVDAGDGGVRAKSVEDYQLDYAADGVTAFAIVGPRPSGCTRVGLGSARAGTQYIDLSTRTGGSAGSICNPNLSEVIQEVLFGALSAASDSTLERTPISGSMGARAGQALPRSRVDGFDYEPTGNAIVFLGTVPPIGAPFEVAYGFFSYFN